MRIVHMSDIHLAENGQEIWDTNTKDHFDKAIKIIGQIKELDAIIVTGDLSNDGSYWSYNYIKDSLTFDVPIFCCPGNHDNSEVMKELNTNLFYLSDFCTDIAGYKLFVLNSTIPGMSRGLLSEASMSWLDESLGNSQMPSIIALHHPPIEPGGWLNRKLLENREDFVYMISKHKNVKLVLYGHIHYSIQHIIDKCCYSAAPSIGFAFDKDLPKYQIASGQEGFNLITITGTDIKIDTILLG